MFAESIVWVIVTGINLVAMLLMGVDKVKAKWGWWRIPEVTFFIVGLCMGALGVWAGMFIFRHKTRHLQFKVGIPVLILLNVGCYVYFRDMLFAAGLLK